MKVKQEIKKGDIVRVLIEKDVRLVAITKELQPKLARRTVNTYRLGQVERINRLSITVFMRDYREKYTSVRMPKKWVKLHTDQSQELKVLLYDVGSEAAAKRYARPDYYVSEVKGLDPAIWQS